MERAPCLWLPTLQPSPSLPLPCSNFSNYRSRFSMPGDTESLWYRCVPGLQGHKGKAAETLFLPSPPVAFMGEKEACRCSCLVWL